MSILLSNAIGRLNFPARKKKTEIRPAISASPIAACLQAGFSRFLISLHETRRRQAMLVLARYRHLIESPHTRRD